jgi:hypothetical protein
MEGQEGGEGQGVANPPKTLAITYIWYIHSFVLWLAGSFSASIVPHNLMLLQVNMQIPQQLFVVDKMVMASQAPAFSCRRSQTGKCAQIGQVMYKIDTKTG